MKVKITEAKKRLSEIVKRASVGEEIEITVNGKVEARIVPPAKEPNKPTKRLPSLEEKRTKMEIRGKSITETLLEMRGGYLL